MPLGVGAGSGCGAASAAASSVGLPDPYPPVHRETAAPHERKPSGLRKISPGPNGATRTVTSLLVPELGSTVEQSNDVFMPLAYVATTSTRPDVQASDLRSDVAASGQEHDKTEPTRTRLQHEQLMDAPCRMCRLGNHQTADCPYPQIPAWRGPHDKGPSDDRKCAPLMRRTKPNSATKKTEQGLITGKGRANPPLTTSAPIQDTRLDTKVSAPNSTPPTHPPSPQSALEIDNPQNTTPTKTRKVKHTDDNSFACNQRHLRSPEDRIATRKSSLPSGSALNADDDPFSLGYQLAHRTQSGLVTHSVTPLAFTEEEELEEGELSQDTEQCTSPANHPAGMDSIPAQPLRIHLTSALSARIAPPSSAHSDVLMEDDTDYGVLARDPGFGAKTPTHCDEDPHIPYDGFNPTGPDDHAGVPFQKHAGGGARLVMSHETMMMNALQHVVDLIASDPDRFILFMPFLGGHHFHNRYRNMATDLAKQLEQVTGVGGIAIYPPSADDTNKANFRWQSPLPPAEVRDSVARHELIACNEDLTVHVSKVDMGHQSWCLGQFRCNSIAPLSAAVPRGAVAVHVFEQGPLRTAIAHATQNEPGAADKRVFDFAEMLRATYLESPTEPIWVIHGCPFTKDHATWERFCDHFRNTKFASGLVEFTPIGSPNRAASDNIRRLALCYICKLEDHHSDTCPYRSLTDFVGTKDVLKPGREGILALVKGKPGARPHDDAPSSSRGPHKQEKPQFWDWNKTPTKRAQTDPAKSTVACCYLRDRKRVRFGMANNRMSAGDGGHIGPCDHMFDDGAHSGGEHVAGNSEEIPTCDEPSAGSMPGIPNDELTTATPARGGIFDAGELHAPHRPVQLGPVRLDETAASGFRTASAMTDPTGRGASGETSLSAASTPHAYNASSAHRNGGAMLSPVRGTQAVGSVPCQSQGSAPEERPPHVHVNGRSGRELEERTSATSPADDGI
ncbi:hypothetical protein B0H14DRAFT_2557582 [Mycena olivaceomarginata]|nr:hypothetical protein B0H14DRAFT_2557582 [Mycena olivaceomarginata]